MNNKTIKTFALLSLLGASEFVNAQTYQDAAWSYYGANITSDYDNTSNGKETIRFRVGTKTRVAEMFKDRFVSYQNGFYKKSLWVDHQLNVALDGHFSNNVDIAGNLILTGAKSRFETHYATLNRATVRDYMWVGSNAEATIDTQLRLKSLKLKDSSLPVMAGDRELLSFNQGETNFTSPLKTSSKFIANNSSDFNALATFNAKASFSNNNGEEVAKIEDGVLTAKRVVLNVGTFPDYVFASDYNLMPLEQVEAYIEQNNHLPNVPSEKEVVEKGMNVGQINTVLMEKVEELTLHLIQQNKELQALKREMKVLKSNK